MKNFESMVQDFGREHSNMVAVQLMAVSSSEGIITGNTPYEIIDIPVLNESEDSSVSKNGEEEEDAFVSD